MSVCVVGAGLAGIACARALQDRGRAVTVLERSRLPGGRMASPRLHGRPVDLGASYLTVRDPQFGAVVEQWARRGLARPWTDTFHVLPKGSQIGHVLPEGSQTGHVLAEGSTKAGPVRWGAPLGLRSLVADLAAGLDVRLQVEVRQVSHGPTVDGAPYDAVVLAMPDPQALAVLPESLAAERAALVGRAWRPVIALAAGWSRRSWTLEGAFVHDDPALSFVADDGRRRGDGAAVLVAHSTAELAARHLAAPEAAVPELVAALRRVLDLPDPQWTVVHRWTWARPDGDREASFRLGESGVGLCGDGWGASRVETAWRSGTDLGAALADRLG